MPPRSSLLSSLEKKDIATFIQCTKELSVDDALTDTLAGFSHRQLLEIWDAVQTMLSQALQDTDMDCANIGELLQCVTRLANGTFTAQNGYELYLPPSLIEVAILIHGIFPSLMSDHSALKDEISSLFEHWWIAEAYGREELIGNTILYLLDKSTGPKSTRAVVTRVYSICHVLDSINLELDSASMLVDLLLQCCVHSQFLNSIQGIKFLAYILTLNPDMTLKLHEAIKNRLPTTPAAWHSKFCDIYFRAWQSVKSPTMKKVIEQQCIQDLMFRAIHASRDGHNSLAKILYRVLSFLHRKKTCKGVEPMLMQLYNPILWRAVMVANSDVRINAATLMFDIFPLQDTDFNREQEDAALQKQFDIMHNLLSDPVSEVRLTAVKGVGRVLNVYWELIPADVIKCFITKLVDDMVYDISSPAVREAVVKVMLQLCDNHLCIPILQNILPQLQNFVHDTSEKVRVAMFDLLLKVKGLRGIKFWNLVPVEHILARLQVDSAPVVRRIMKLLQPSFVPLHESAGVQVERCITLVKMNMAASRQFFLNLPHCLSFDDTVKYITILCRALVESARKLKGQIQSGLSPCNAEENDDSGNSGKNSGGKAANKKCSPQPKKKVRKTKKKDVIPSVSEHGGDDEDDSTACPTDNDILEGMIVFRGLVEAVYLMHTVILNELDVKENQEIKEGLSKKLTVVVRELMTVSKDPKLDEALVTLASHLPLKTIPHVAQNLFKRLKSSSGFDGSFDTKLIIKSLVLWGKAESVIQLIQESLENLFQKDKGTSQNITQAQTTKSKKTVAFVADEAKISPDLACTLIVNMITPAEFRLILLTKHKRSLVALVDSLAPALTELGAYFTGGNTSLSDAKLYFDVLAVSLRLTAFLCAENKDEDETTQDHLIQVINRTLSWCSNCLVAHLSHEEVGHRELATTHLETILRLCSNLLMVGLVRVSFLEAVVELFKTVLIQPAASIRLKSCVLRGIYQLSHVMKYKKLLLEDDRTVLLADFCSFSIDCIFGSLPNAATISGDQEDGDNVDGNERLNLEESSHNFSAVISETVAVILELTSPEAPPRVNCEKLVASILAFMLKEATSPLHQSLTSGKETLLPPITSSVMAVFKKRDALKKMFFVQLQNFLDLANPPVTLSQVQGLLAIIEVLTPDFANQMLATMYKSLSNALVNLTVRDLNEEMIGDLKRRIEEKLHKYADMDTAL